MLKSLFILQSTQTMCVTAGVFCAFSPQHNRELALRLCLPLIVHKSAFLKGGAWHVAAFMLNTPHPSFLAPRYPSPADLLTRKDS